ncbi:MAG: TonB-dependent receptor plug domain-containing protein, partial [Candidatus Marinimicrobia bacterium]|nr:TonB-dependent receptor plug domain-containing protein [Candidatus Neomarinimicrobiota bacterium]
MKTTFVLITFFISFNFAQQTIEGYVIDSTTTKPIYNANINIVSSAEGTASNKNGYFNFITDLLYPIELQINHIGYKPEQIIVTSYKKLQLQLVPIIITGDTISVFGFHSKIEKDVSTSFETITLAEMEQIGANDLSDVLQTISSANIEQSSGGKQTISIRGSNPHDVSVFLDGIRLNEANSGIANLAAIDQQDLASIKVIKGGNTSLFGSGALGGVLSLSTQLPDSTKLKFHRGLGMMDNENNDLGFSAASRLGIFGLGVRYSGKARRYHGRSIYTTIFKNISLAGYPSWGEFNIKGFELQDYLTFPTQDIVQNAKTQMAMFRYRGSVFGSSNWEIFAGARSWNWHDEFFTSVIRDIEDRNSSVRIGRSFTFNNMNATVQFGFEDQLYDGENQYIYDMYSISDTGLLNRQTADIATVLHLISFIAHPSLKRIHWELGY